jgi:hypothetical protein
MGYALFTALETVSVLPIPSRAGAALSPGISGAVCSRHSGSVPTMRLCPLERFTGRETASATAVHRREPVAVP